MKVNQWRGILSGAALIGLLFGCHAGSRDSEISGAVTLDGTKIGPGTIVFAPVAPGGKAATGTIESDGTYTIKKTRDLGLTAGGYRVAVSIHKMPENVKPGDRPPVGKSLIPEKYEDETKSGLQYDVSAGRNTINIELVSK